MGKVHNILDYDLCIAHSWNNPDNADAPEHGISGHTFEMIEYYWYIKSHINCCLLWTETMSAETLKNVLESKYNFDDKEIQNILDHSIFIYRPKLLRVKNILLVDGYKTRDKGIIIIYDHMFMFSCGSQNNHLIFDKKTTVLHDYRIYHQGCRTKHYVKKILFNRFKSLHNVKHQSFLYLTTNCRYMPEEEVKNCIKSFDSVFEHCPDRKWIIGTNKPEAYEKIEANGYAIIKELPILNFMEEFNHYVYTPIERKFDCSNRLLAECKHYDKIISLYNIDDEYLEQDLGLKYRLEDIKNLESITLIRKDQDEIINILREVIK